MKFVAVLYLFGDLVHWWDFTIKGLVLIVIGLVVLD